MPKAAHDNRPGAAPERQAPLA